MIGPKITAENFSLVFNLVFTTMPYVNYCQEGVCIPSSRGFLAFPRRDTHLEQTLFVIYLPFTLSALSSLLRAPSKVKIDFPRVIYPMGNVNHVLGV